MNETKIITNENSDSMPIINLPKVVFPTKDNYGTSRFHKNEVIICKDVAFLITFISNKKMSLKLLDKKFADKLIAGGTI